MTDEQALYERWEQAHEAHREAASAFVTDMTTQTDLKPPVTLAEQARIKALRLAADDAYEAWWDVVSR